MVCNFRRRASMPMSRMHAKAASPADGQRNFLAGLYAEVAAVVFTVSVVVCADAPEIVTEVGIVHVAGTFASAGVIAQLRLTVPINPPDGVKVTVEVFPVVAPGVTVTAVSLIAKLGGARLMVYTAVASGPAVAPPVSVNPSNCVRLPS